MTAANPRITREQLISASVQAFTRNVLYAERGFTEAQVQLLESYNDVPHEEIDRTYAALGAAFSDGGEQAEIGSPLRRTMHTLILFVLGQDAVWAENVASNIAQGYDEGAFVPLLDISQAGNPVVDDLEVHHSSYERHTIANPEPWEAHVWTVHLQVIDIWNARLG